MRKRWIVLIAIIFIIIYLIAIQKNSNKEGCDTKIAYWKFDSNILNKKKFSLLDTSNNGIFAPGSQGNFEIVLDSCGSDVEIEYNIVVSKEENLPQNLKFNMENKKEKYNSLKELFDKSDFSGTLKSEIKKYRIFWEWPFENYKEDGSIDREKDLLDYEAGTSNLSYNFYLCVNANQIK